MANNDKDENKEADKKQRSIKKEETNENSVKTEPKLSEKNAKLEDTTEAKKEPSTSIIKIPPPRNVTKRKPLDGKKNSNKVTLASTPVIVSSSSSPTPPSQSNSNGLKQKKVNSANELIQLDTIIMSKGKGDVSVSNIPKVHESHSSSSLELSKKMSILLHRASTPSIEVIDNPLHNKEKKIFNGKLTKQSANSHDSIHERLPVERRRKKSDLISLSSGGIDDADGIFITKSEFLQQWSDNPKSIADPYNWDTEENVLHFLAREGKYDVLKDLCNAHKGKSYISQALSRVDKFGQTPMLSAINALENRNEILKFLLELIYNSGESTVLQEATLLNCNKHNDSLLTLLMKNHEAFRETRKILFKIFVSFYDRDNRQSEGFHKLLYQILQQNSCEVNSKSLSDMIRELAQVQPEFFQEENNLFEYTNSMTRSNILMELAKSAKDDALRELLVNRLTYRHVTHRILQERNREGQTLMAIIEVNRVSLAESLPIVLKKEYGCHRRDVLKTEQCLSRQLESSMSASYIINELNDLENSDSCLRKFKIWLVLFITWLTPTIGLTFGDIFFDALLTVEYYRDYTNQTFIDNAIQRCTDCKEGFNSTNFNTSEETIHCYESCFSSEARLGYTLAFLLLPIVFYLTEFLTLTDKYEVTTLRRKVCKSIKEINMNKWKPLNLVGSICKFLGWFCVTFIVIVFWQPITALFKFYRDGLYEIATENKRVDARIRKRRSDLTASRGELIEVNVESAFEPIIQGYIIFPNIIDIAAKLADMVTVTDDGKVEISLQFTTVETAQLFSIGTSMVSLAWCYSEYHSVRKNMLLDITISPLSRVVMFLYMLMQIVARLLAFQLFALYWGPGNLYPLVIFVIIHMFISSILHIIFSEDLFYLRKKKYLKFVHNVLMNAFATIYFHNYLRMDEMPKVACSGCDQESGIREEADSQTPGLHISTFMRQVVFDILYFIEIAILLGFGFYSKIVAEGFLGKYTSTFIWIVTVMIVTSLILKFFYYNVLHIWSNTIFTTTRINTQPFSCMGYQDTIRTKDNEEESRFIEYVFISSNSWFLGKLKTIRTTILILPRKLLLLIEGQGKKLGGNIVDPLDAAAGRVGAIDQWKATARDLLHWRKTIAVFCCLPLVLLGILVPLVIIIILVLALVLSLPLMLILLFYNLFGNCRNIIDATIIDNYELQDRDIEDLPPEIDSIENPIFSCNPSLTLRKVQENLAGDGILNLSSKPEMSIEELDNLTVLLLSLNPRRHHMRELNLDDSRLTDEKLKIIAPVLVRFSLVKIGGKQDFASNGLKNLALYMNQVSESRMKKKSEKNIPSKISDRVLLKRLEMKNMRSKIGMTDFTWVNEEVKDIEKEDERLKIVNELANLIPFLNSLLLDGYLRESAVRPVNTMIGKNIENSNLQLWQCLNQVNHMEYLSLRDCSISDRVFLKCITGFANIRKLDVSGNQDISILSWKALADSFKTTEPRLVHLVFQTPKYTIDEECGGQFASMFRRLHKLDLKKCQISDAAVNKFIETLSDEEAVHPVTIEKIDLTDCNLSQGAMELFDEFNRTKASDVILFKIFEANKRKAGGVFSSFANCKCCE